MLSGLFDKYAVEDAGLRQDKIMWSIIPNSECTKNDIQQWLDSKM